MSDQSQVGDRAASAKPVAPNLDGPAAVPDGIDAPVGGREALGVSHGDAGHVGRVLVVGDIVTDVVAMLGGPVARGTDTPARVAMAGGGAGGNTAAWLAWAGVPVTLCGVVGADEAGEARLLELSECGVDLSVRRAEGAATGTIVVLAEGGERTFLTDRGANLLLSPADVDAAFSADVVHVHVSGYPLLDASSRAAGRHALGVAAERGVTTSIDAASAGPLRRVGGEVFRSWVRGCDVLFANLDEASVLVGSAAGELAVAVSLAGFVSRVPHRDDVTEAPSAATAAPNSRRDERETVAVVKLGTDGVMGACGTRVIRVPAEATEAVDSTGAGDAFAAGFIRARLGGADLEDALRAGVALGARAVGLVGARPPRVTDLCQ